MRYTVRVLEILEATEGGTRRHLVDLVTHLDPARFDISVACSTLRDASFADDLRLMESRGIAVHIIPMRRAISPFRDALAFLRLVRLMRRERYDVVHTHSSKAGFLGRLAARVARVPWVIHTPHTFAFEMTVGGAARFFYVCLERFAARLTDRLICVCPSQRAAAAALMDPARVVVIENGIGAMPECDSLERVRRRRELRFEDSHLVVGVVGRFTAQKGHRHFVEAACQVAVRVPEARFLLVGDGVLRPAIERQIAAAGLAERVIIVGACDDVPSLMPLLDVAVLPSLWEGLPYTLLEAMAAGRAVVASRVGGIPDVIVDGENGLLVPPADPTALAAAVVKVLENAAFRSTIGRKARETLVGRCRLDEMVRRMADVYERR